MWPLPSRYVLRCFEFGEDTKRSKGLKKGATGLNTLFFESRHQEMLLKHVETC